MTSPITAYVPPLTPTASASRPKDHKGKKHFSFIGDLKHRASEALGGSAGSDSGKQRQRPASAMNISVIREGEEGAVPSGVKMGLVPVGQATPPSAPHKKKKPSRAATNFACNIFTENSEDFESAMEECKQMVREAGGTILEMTYPGGFLYDLSFATKKDPLDNLDETAGGGYITIEPYSADILPHPHPLRSHPAGMSAGIARSVLEHMHRFGLAANAHMCNGRDKPCLPGCEFRRTTRGRPMTEDDLKWEDDATTRVSDSAPQLAPTRPLSTIRVEDIFELGDNQFSAPTTLSPQRLKRNSKHLSLLLEKDDTLTWLDNQETVKQFKDEIANDGKNFVDGKRPRPSPIFGTVENNRFVANCRPPIPRRSSSLKRSSNAVSEETKDLLSRRDSVVTAVQTPTSPTLHPRTPLGSVEPYSPISLDAPLPPPNSPRSDEARPMSAELSTENIEKLQQKLAGVEECFGCI